MRDQRQAGKPLGAKEILLNVRGLVPYLRERREAIEKGRRLPADVVKKLREAGAFRLNMPKAWGGPELTSVEQCEVIEEISRGDAAAGWCVMIGCDSGIFAGYLDDAVARSLYPHLDSIQAGFAHPIGVAERVRGGYLVSGHWPYGSGSSHCDRLGAGCMVVEDGAQVVDANGRPETLYAIARPSDFEILDTWDTTGLRGTGSNDYLCSKLFVPEEHTLCFTRPAKRDGTSWRRADALVRKMAGVPLGIAREALDSLIARAEQGLTAGPDPALWSAIAEAEAKLGSARAYLYDSLDAQWRRLDRHEPLSKREEANGYLSRMNAFQASREVVRSVYDLVGGDSIYAKKAGFDRHLRDIETACQHRVAQKKVLRGVGAFLANPDAFPLF